MRQKPKSISMDCWADGDPHHKVEDIRANPVELVQSIRMEGDEVEQETEAEGVGA
jgi:hypothetical protein